GRSVLEACRPLDHAHAEAGEPLLRVGRRDCGDHASYMIAHPREVDLRTAARHAERRRLRELRRLAGRRDQRLRGDATIVETIAAKLALLDQHHRHADCGPRCRGRQPAGAGPDHADVGREDFGHADGVLDGWLASSGRAWAALKRLTATGISASTPSVTRAAMSCGVAAV